MKVQLFEIFTSVEGEGILFGTKTLFVRLAGCPFTCFYCDTKESLPLDSGKEYTIDEACKLIDTTLQNQTYKVNFTGGDPLIQHHAVAELAKHIQSKKIPTYLESSCFDSERFNNILPFIDIVKIEFKTKDSDFVDSKHYERLIGNAIRCLESSVSAKKTTYIKIVVSSKTKSEDLKSLVDKIFHVVSKDQIDGFVIQPTFGVAEPSLDLLLELYDIVYPYYGDVKVVPQLHKLIGAP
ncbi:MAG: organic radical-activating protein [Nitrosopumilales archaeon CG15_BIG_FIL_POST_REV_8_21_14_020_37_12]|nr:MAG: organic radical-activating protein [Nitrosopumilales archaeon CG15_BIG_FIL_POST_REV_8_21_14_020_37_12]